MTLISNYVSVPQYRSVDLFRMFHFAIGWKAPYQPGIIALVKACRNGLRFNIGGYFIVFCWPSEWSD